MKKIILALSVFLIAISSYSQTFYSDLFIAAHHKIWSTCDSAFVDWDSTNNVISIQSGLVPGTHNERLVIGLNAAQFYVTKGSHISIIKNEWNQNLLQNDFVDAIIAPMTIVSDTLMLNHDPYTPMESATKQYVDNYRLPHIIFAPVTGGTVNLVANAYNIINPSAASLASLTFHFPAMNNNDVIIIKSTKKIISLTITGQTVAYSITPITIGTFIYLTYDASAGVLY